MSSSDYEQNRQSKNHARRQELLAQLEQLRQKVRARNPDLSDDQADAIADELTREAIQTMIDDGRIIYKPQ